MSDDNSTPVDVTDDLDAFSAELFGGSTTPKESAPVEEPKADPVDNDAEDTSPVDDTDATNDATDDDGEGDNAPVEKPKKQSAQERINELTRQKREAERAQEAWETRFKELEARLGKTDEDPTPAATNVTGIPDPDALKEDGTAKYPLGEYDPQFIRDNAQFIFREEMKAVREAEEQTRKAQQVEQERIELNTTWNTKLETAEATEDFSDIREKGIALVEQLSDLPQDYGTYLADIIMGMDKGIEVFYYLANNPDEALAIVSKGAKDATIALGRIEGKVLGAAENGKVVNKPKVSSAPPPPPAVNRGSSGKFDVRGDTDDLDAFEAAFFKKK